MIDFKAKKKIEIQGKSVRVISNQAEDYVCITDMAKSGNSDNKHHDIIKGYFRNRNNIEFLGLWEELHNENFNSGEFDLIRNSAGVNRFTLSVGEWIKRTNSTGVYAKAGRYGGTYVHKDIAVHFATWLSPATYLYLIKEFQRLKEEENEIKNLEWHISKITDYVDNARVLLDSIPFQKVENVRVSLDEEE